MTSFDSAAHPRGHASNAGSFSEKTQNVPGWTLPAGSIPEGWKNPVDRIPAELRRAHGDITLSRLALQRDEDESQQKVAKEFTAFLRRAWPDAAYVDFAADSDEPNDIPEFIAVYEAGDEDGEGEGREVYAAWTDADADRNVRAYAAEITGPYAEGTLLDPVELPRGEQVYRFHIGR